jgi:transposase InsO family protein
VVAPCGAPEGRVEACGASVEWAEVAPASNQRWASDGLEIPCWNGEVVRIAFAIDTHDREIIAWVATFGSGISGEMIRDLMLDCVERRFDAIRAPQPIQWLADNGSAFTATETTDFAVALNLVPCFTPVRSPESNGVCEAFVKTLKRDYACVNPRPDAISVLQQLPDWFEDYCPSSNAFRQRRRLASGGFGPSGCEVIRVAGCRPAGGACAVHGAGER